MGFEYVKALHIIFVVTWPKFSFLQNSAVLVLVASLIFALFIGVVDLGFENIMTWFYDLF